MVKCKAFLNDYWTIPLRGRLVRTSLKQPWYFARKSLLLERVFWTKFSLGAPGERKYWGLRKLNIIILTYFFYKINKGDLPLMYSCVFWCEFIDLVGFFGCYCLTPVPLFIIRSKGSTEKQPGVRTLSTRRRFAAQKPIESQIFSTRGKLLSSLHRSKRLKAKYLHACCWKWTFLRAMSKIPFTRRCDTVCSELIAF